MPYLHCPQCRRTSWARTTSDERVECRHCGRDLELAHAAEVSFLTAAVRERFARDARAGGSVKRFVRDRL